MTKNLGGNPARGKVDLVSLEADVAFFDARLSLASSVPDSVYQRAQVKTYETLGRLMGGTLEKLRKRKQKQKRKRRSA